MGCCGSKPVHTHPSDHKLFEPTDGNSLEGRVASGHDTSWTHGMFMMTVKVGEDEPPISPTGSPGGSANVSLVDSFREDRSDRKSSKGLSQGPLKHAALIIVDVQNDFVSGSLKVGETPEAIIEPINRLRDRFDFGLVVHTQDSHPIDHCSFVDNHPDATAFAIIDIATPDGNGYMPQVMWPRHCVEGTFGWMFDDSLVVNESDYIQKIGTDRNVDTYSGFFDNLKGMTTGLDKVLHSHGITDVYVVGLAYDYCAGLTACDAARLGFNTYLVKDLTRFVSLDSARDMDAALQSAGVRIIQKNQIKASPGHVNDDRVQKVSKKAFAKTDLAKQYSLSLLGADSNHRHETTDTTDVEVGVSSVPASERRGNEDRAAVTVDLYDDTKVANTSVKDKVVCLSVIDGHDGPGCAIKLEKVLHQEIAKSILRRVDHAHISEAVRDVFDNIEQRYCLNDNAGACCCSVILIDKWLYCANCGDSHAVLVRYNEDSFTPVGKPIHLADRHTFYTSKNERQRLKKLGAEISKKKGSDGAVVSRHPGGGIHKTLMPSRCFGDADFKIRSSPRHSVVATPTGVGIGHEGGPVCLKKGEAWLLLVASDGLWDFVPLKKIIHAVFERKRSMKELAGHLVRMAKGEPFGSNDDTTVIAARIRFEES